MNYIFRDSKLRLVRAKIHFGELQRMINGFFDEKPYTITIEPDPDGIHQLYTIKFTKGLPVGFAIITADAVDNLRATLDLAWYAIALASGAINPGSEAKFPFADNITKFDGMLSRGFKKFPKEIITLLRSFKPYKGGNDLLWALNRICAANKHRMLAPICLQSGSINYLTGKPAKWNTSKDYIYRMRIDPPINYDANLTFDIAFDEVEVVSGKPVIAILNDMMDMVFDILDILEKEVQRLGFI